MKILFIKPPINHNVFTFTRYEPLEFEYLAASVSDNDTDIFDMRIENDLMKKLESYNPDVVGITAYTCDVKTVKNILKEIKKYKRTIRTVIGGNHVTFFPQDFNDGLVDTIFIGYADHTFPKYINALNEGTDVREIENLGFPEDGEIFFTEKRSIPTDLDLLPFPARYLTEKYRKKYHDSLRNKIALVMSSRGCPFRCTFCSCWKLMDGRYTTRKVDSVVQELRSLPDDIDIVYFSDDNTVHNVQRAWKLAEKIKEHEIKIKLQMYARTDTIVKNPELFRSLREAGLEYLTIGFESFSEEGLLKLNKKTTLQMNDEAIRILKNLGIYINAHFIVNPEFTEKDFNGLLHYIDERHLFRPVYPVLTPLPGTQLYEKTRKEHVIRDYDFFDFAHSILPTKLERKKFYRQLALLYNKSYSLKRYLKFMYTKKRMDNSRNTDGISLLKLILIRIIAVFLYFKMKNVYKSETLYHE